MAYMEIKRKDRRISLDHADLRATKCLMVDAAEAPPANLDPNYSRGDWVRLRTLVALRWLAIAGQTGAVFVASRYIGLDLRLDLCGLAIGASVLFNIVALLSNPASKRLNERTTTLTLLFDVTQLAVLLYLTGGLSNPFSLLLLAPVTVAATTLALKSTILIGLAVVADITFLVFQNAPLHLSDGRMIAQPSVLIYGMWVSMVIGVLFVAGYARRITLDNHSMSQALSATQLALAREQQLTALGGVVAAAAHELGTPLATIKLVSTELSEELIDRPDLLEDVKLIADQSERCRYILKEMGRSGRDDALMRHAPLMTVIEEAAEPHLNRGKDVVVRLNGAPFRDQSTPQPFITRQPEIVHSLRNLIQNAVDYAKSTVWIDVTWDDDTVGVSVGDDGWGYPADLVGSLGEPYVGTRRRAGGTTDRPGYKGMGLGLFIAKTLLERTGATLSFRNATPLDRYRENMANRSSDEAAPIGAIVDVIWDRSGLVEDVDPTRTALGRNDLNLP